MQCGAVVISLGILADSQALYRPLTLTPPSYRPSHQEGTGLREHDRFVTSLLSETPSRVPSKAILVTNVENPKHHLPDHPRISSGRP